METEASCSVHSNGDSHGDSHGDSRGQNGDHNGSSSPPKLDLSNSNGSPDLTSSKSPPSGPPNDTNGRESIKELNNRRALESPKESKGFQIHYSDTHLQNELDQQNASTRPASHRAHTESKRPDSHHSNGRPIADLRRSNECKLIDKSIDKLYTASSGAAAHHHHHKPSSTTSKPIHKSTHKSSADKPPTDCSRSIDQPANVQRPKSNDIHSKLASRSIDKSTISKSRDERSARDESRKRAGLKRVDRLVRKGQTTSDKAADKPVPDKSSSDKPSSSDKSFADKPSSDKPSLDKPSFRQTVVLQPFGNNQKTRGRSKRRLTGIIGCSGSDIETTTMSAYRESVAKNYCRGTFRTGPLHQISVVGTAREEVGGYFPDFIDILEKCPFLKPVMPWGQLSNLKMGITTGKQRRSDFLDLYEPPDLPVHRLGGGRQTEPASSRRHQVCAGQPVRQRCVLPAAQYHSSVSNGHRGGQRCLACAAKAVLQKQAPAGRQHSIFDHQIASESSQSAEEPKKRVWPAFVQRPEEKGGRQGETKDGVRR
ncbi:hypothetical protein L1887_48787 [Cichorium endivia]|nr:hypothetical protein L1887_48787 [Cichorium endivia]